MRAERTVPLLPSSDETTSMKALKSHGPGGSQLKKEFSKSSDAAVITYRNEEEDQRCDHDERRSDGFDEHRSDGTSTVGQTVNRTRLYDTLGLLQKKWTPKSSKRSLSSIFTQDNSEPISLGTAEASFQPLPLSNSVSLVNTVARSSLGDAAKVRTEKPRVTQLYSKFHHKEKYEIISRRHAAKEQAAKRMETRQQSATTIQRIVRGYRWRKCYRNSRIYKVLMSRVNNDGNLFKTDPLVLRRAFVCLCLIVRFQSIARGFLTRRLLCRKKVWVPVLAKTRKVAVVQAAAMKLQATARGYNQRKRYETQISGVLVIEWAWIRHKLDQQLHFHATKIQKSYRGSVARQLYQKRAQSVVVIQSWCRMAKDKSSYSRQLSRCEMLPRNWRRTFHLRRYLRMRNGFIALQSVVRAAVCRRECDALKRGFEALQRIAKEKYFQSTRAATLLQRQARFLVARQKYHQIRLGVIKLQSQYRRRTCVSECQTLYRGFTCLQRHWRAKQMRSQYIQMRCMVVSFQAHFRRRLERLAYLKQISGFVILQQLIKRRFESKLRASQKLQNRWRMACTLALYKRQLRGMTCLQHRVKMWFSLHAAAATLVQKTWRRCRAQSRYEYTVNLVLCVQKQWRCKSQHFRYLQLRGGISQLQGIVEAWFQQRSNAAVHIQKQWRCASAQRSYHEQKRSSVIIQSAFRSWSKRRSYEALLSAAWKVQTTYKMFHQRKSRQIVSWIRNVASTIISSWWRMAMRAKMYSKLLRGVIVVQLRFRARSLLDEKVLTFQRHRHYFLPVRDTVGQASQMSFLQSTAATKIQRLYRKNLNGRCLSRAAVALERALAKVQDDKQNRDESIHLPNLDSSVEKEARDESRPRSQSKASRTPRGEGSPSRSQRPTAGSNKSRKRSTGPFRSSKKPKQDKNESSSALYQFDFDELLSPMLTLLVDWPCCGIVYNDGVDRPKKRSPKNMHKIVAVIRIQRQWKTVQLQRKVKALEDQAQAARTIQSFWRQNRRQVLIARRAVAKIEIFWYSTKIRTHTKAAITIQSLWRGIPCRWTYGETVKVREEKARVIQTTYRGWKCQVRYQLQREATIMIQRRFRTLVARKAVTLIQSAWRQHRCTCAKRLTPDSQGDKLAGFPTILLKAGVAWVIADLVLEYVIGTMA